MANPRQRRKAKSLTHKAVSHSRRAKRLQKKMPAICGPKSLQDAWDPFKTVRQNYTALGLEHDLDPISSGGSEIHLGRTVDQADTSQPGPTASTPSIESGQCRASEGSALPKGFGRIIRDASGNAVRVELANDEEAVHRELEVDAPVVPARSELRMWAYDRAEAEARPTAGVKTAVQDLETLAGSVTVRKRQTSLGERAYLERLVRAHGDDVTGMARDRRLNPEQRTAGELRRAMARAGGCGALCEATAREVAGSPADVRQRAMPVRRHIWGEIA